MKMNELGIPDVKALVAFGKLGLAILASRMLSMTALLGILALSADSIYASSWQGAVCVAVLAFLVFMPALKAEAKRDAKED